MRHLPGGSGEDAFLHLAELAFDRASGPDIDAVAIFFTLSATSLKPAVTTVIDTIARVGFSKSIAVGFAATGAAEREMTTAEARDAFERIGLRCVGDPVALAAALQAELPV